MPLVAAALSSVAAAATTSAAGASTSTARATTCAKRFGVMSEAPLEAQADGHVLETDELEALQPLILDVAADAVRELRREAAGQPPVRRVGVVRCDQHRGRARGVRIVRETHAEHVDVVLELADVIHAKMRQQYTPRQVPRVRESQSGVAGHRLELLFVINQVQTAGAGFREAVDPRVDVEEAEVG